MAHGKYERSGQVINRRTFIGGTAAIAATGFAATARATGRFDAGDGELIILSDGSMTFPIGFSYPGGDAAEAARLLGEAGRPTDRIENGCNITLLRRGDRLVIFDVGAGPNFLPTTGKLPETLAEAGIDPAEVTDVIFTHAHPDHLWGLTDEFDELLFAQARYHMARAEWDFWIAPGAIDALPEDRKNFAVGAANRLPLIENRVALFRPGDEVVPGVEAIDTAGHTPGHVSFAIHGGAGGPR